MSLLEKYGVPENIVAHSKQVAKVAAFLGGKLLEKGEEINLPRLKAACLLHDVDKKLCLGNPKLKHAVKGAKILEKEGFTEIAAIVKQHRLGHILEGPFSGWEAKLLYYSDKRVRHSEIVSLGERFEYLVERYGSKSPEYRKDIEATRSLVFALEREIFEIAGIATDLGELK